MVGDGENSGHKHSRVNGRRISNLNIHQGSQTIINPHEDRQHISTILPSEDGGHEKSEDVSNCQENLALLAASQDHDYCRMDSIPSEHFSRLGVQKCVRLSGMETLPKGIPVNSSGDGTTRFRSIRIKDLSSGESLLQLEGGPKLPGSGRLSSELESRLSLRFPSILSDNKGAETGGNTISTKNDTNNTSMAITTMVPCSSGNVNSTSITLKKFPKSVKKPCGFNSPLASGIIPATSGLASIRDRLTEEGLSPEAIHLVLNARSKGTIQNYESAWKEWRRWCSGRSVDPFTCSLTQVLNYLGHMFDSGYEYRSIGVHRSAISAYHIPLTNSGLQMTVGRHPQVSSLMSGVQNLRPPRPKYAFTWDIEVVLNLFRSWPLDLTLKQLTIKVTTLLALIGIPRGAELHMFDLNYLAKYGGRYTFDLAGNIKNGKEGVVPQPVVFHQHLDDKKLCPVSCIDKYISETAAWRPNGLPSKFFLSFKTHKPVTKSSLARWIKQALHWADVDTEVFQAHSLRGASTSKAFLKGLAVKDVVNHGKWSLESTWQKYYHKPMYHPSKKYQDSILQL